MWQGRSTVILFLASCCFGGEPTYYRQFLLITDTNSPDLQAITSPQLIEPNNSEVKLAGETVSVERMRSNGEFCRLRLGEGMDEVIAAWGKPPEVWWNGLIGRTRFDYTSVTLSFSGNRLQSIRANWPVLRSVRFEPAPPPRSKIKEWAAALEPALKLQDGHEVHLVSRTNQVVLTACFRWEDAPVYQLRLERDIPRESAAKALERQASDLSRRISKNDAAVLARFALRDHGIRLEDYKAPYVYDMKPGPDRGYFWLVYFAFKDPVPDSGIFVRVGARTGDVVVDPE